MILPSMVPLMQGARSFSMCALYTLFKRLSSLEGYIAYVFVIDQIR